MEITYPEFRYQSKKLEDDELHENSSNDTSQVR